MQHVRHACLVLNCVYYLRFRLHRLPCFIWELQWGGNICHVVHLGNSYSRSRALSHISSVRKGWGQGEIGGPCSLAWKPNQETIPRVKKVITCQQLLHFCCISYFRETEKIKCSVSLALGKASGKSSPWLSSCHWMPVAKKDFIY